MKVIRDYSKESNLIKVRESKRSNEVFQADHSLLDLILKEFLNVRG